MRLGLSDAFLPERLDDFSPLHARRAKELGFSGIFSRFTAHDPHEVTQRQCGRVRDVLSSEGIEMFQATGYRPTLVHPDETARGEAVQTLHAALRIAGWLGAGSIDTGPGSLSANGPWAPDPYNFTQQASQQLVKSLRESAAIAEEYGVLLCLEGHQLVTTRSPDVMREIVDAVGSPWVRVDFDPANWITLDTIYASGPAIKEMAATLGDRIASAHVKDVVLRDTMMVHLDHCPAGRGMLDIAALLKCMEALNPLAPVIVEAAATSELPDVCAFLKRTARENGVEIV